MNSTRRLVQSAVLVSLALALSYAECFIPLQLLIPLPCVKLGLANVVTLIALYLLGGKSAFSIPILRCVMDSVFGSDMTGLLFSLTGGILSMSVMALCKNTPVLSVYGVSILCEDSGLASTGLFLMDRQQGGQLAQQCGAEVLWIAADGTEYMTASFADRLRD